ncbi:ABC transporter ATP-binding protein/permease [Peptococcaceae bacterium]|nr:ABC transporter ATP-binding protein/permease [Peptococcaceae bacterium]
MSGFSEIYRRLHAKEKRLLALSVLLWILWSLAGASVIIITLLMVKEILTPGYQLATIYYYWAVIGGVIILKGMLLAVANTTSHFAGYALVGRLRSELISRLKSFSLGFYSKERLGNISTVVHHDVNSIEILVAHLWTRMFSDIFVALLILTGLLILDWRLGLALISLLPLAFIVLWIGQKKGLEIQKQNQDNMVNMTSAFVEYTKGIPVLKIFSENPVIFQKLQDKINRFGHSSNLAARRGGVYIGSYFFFMELCFAVLAAAGAYLFLGQSIDLVVYIIFIILGREFYRPLANVEAYFVYYIVVRNSYNRVNAILEHPVVPEAHSPQKPLKYNLHFNIELFQYQKSKDNQDNQKTFALKNINFAVPADTVTALVGPSGSGKTTIANLLVRFWDVNKGDIKIGGIDTRDVAYDQLLSTVSFVMQDVILFDATIYENIRTGKRNATKAEIIDAAKKAMIHDFIISLPKGYNTKIGELGSRLSGGEKQRLSIARVILKDAPVIILDEATSAIDPVNEYKIQKALNNLIKGKTVLVIAHRLKTIRHVDQIIVLKDGQIAEQGQHQQLLEKQGLYRSLWDAQGQVSKQCLA